MLKELTTEDFEQEIKDGIVIVDFYAVWCGPCKMMHPIMEQLKDLYDDIKIIKVNVDNHEELSRKYGIMSIPTIILFKNGTIAEKNVGFLPLENIKTWIEQCK